MMSGVSHEESDLSARVLSTSGALPELLAPAGDWDCARAAVENGANAIYFGLERFNARMRANNFTEADLPKLLEFLHTRGVKGYLTFNTLVFENELADAEQYLRTMIAAGVDAAIVQDVGMCRLIRQLSPDFPIHVSTQMTVTSAAGIEFAAELGCDLVVLARECSLKDIELIQAAQSQSARRLPLEVFVHGALCVAYSGQCLTSEALGGRSANRGECAQACRMPYELVADGREVALGGKKYLLSPQDLAGLDLLPELTRLGIASLKIEGRLKSADYVASITRIYRHALDRFAASTTPQADERVQAQYGMEMAFSRGLYSGWFRGINNQELVHAHFGKKRGVFLGEVQEVRPDGVLALLVAALKPGDGLVFDSGRPEEQEEGGRVYEVRTAGKNGARNSQAGSSLPVTTSQLNSVEARPSTTCLTWLSFGRGDVNLSRVHAGDKLWKTSDPELERRLRQSYAEGSARQLKPLSFEVHGEVGKPLTLIARDEHGHIARLDSAMPLVKAVKQPLRGQKLREQLGRLGGTPFELGHVRSEILGELMLPVSELNRLRRDAVVELLKQRARPKRWLLEQTRELKPAWRGSTEADGSAELTVLVRTMPQFGAALKSGLTQVYCDFEDPKKYREAVAEFREAQWRTPELRDSTIWVAPPRISKMGEEWILKQVRSAEADGYLVRNYDHLKFFEGQRMIGDYSLNIANRFAADYLQSRYKLERLTPSYDLNFGQLEALLRAFPAKHFEVTVHQHMPMFHMEHCVFCAFLTTGTDYRDCGRPCDTHDLKLRDRVGAEHPVKADAGCRNTVFNALAQTGADYARRMGELGVRYFRLEFLNESAEQVVNTVTRYRQLLAGEITGQQLWSELKLLNQLGVTRGQISGQRKERAA